MIITNNYNKNQYKPKKEIKWYTYVDSELDSRLKTFMEAHGIKNQANMMRISVNNYMDYVDAIDKKKSLKDPKTYVEKEYDDFIRNAINSHEISDNFQEELKQRISPLKVTVLMLNKLLNEPERFEEVFNNAKFAIEELENIIKQRYDEPKLIRFVKKIDILYIEDNELERKTVDTYFKRNGVNIKSIETADEGFHILKELTPKVILVDINLKTSKINGDQFCKMLKSNGEYGNVPIILISAVINEQEKTHVLENTLADETIIKPIEKLKDLDVVFKYIKNL